MLRDKTPLLWTLFSVGGTLSALFFPVLVFLTGIAVPLGWIEAPRHESLLELFRHPVVRLFLFAVISFPLFHGAHRFRYTLYDGLKLKHLTVPIVAVCYGTALAGTIFAGYVLLVFP